jgi:imidazolonepropionase-like amidohydrolase
MSGSLLLHNATVFDATGAGARPRTSVLVEDGRIARVAPAATVKPPAGCH